MNPARDIELVISNRTGLHARPAREFVNVARRFQSEVRVHHGARRANGKSLAALLTLGVRSGGAIRIEVEGADGEAALQALAAAVTAGLGEAGDAAMPTAAAAPVAVAVELTGVVLAVSDGDRRLLRGVSAAPGLALGPIHQLRVVAAPVGEVTGDPEDECRRLDTARAIARDQLAAARRGLVERGAADQAAILDVQIDLLDDPELAAAVRQDISAGAGAARAWSGALVARAAALAGLTDDVLAGRAADFTDLADRVVRALAGGAAGDALPDHPVIVVAPDLSPSQTSAFDAGRVLGICTASGGPTSHAAILARALGLPSVVGAGPDVLSWPEGAVIALDGTTGAVLRDPAPAEADRVRDAQAARAARRDVDRRSAAAPAVTLDGHRIEVAANVASVDEARRAAAAGAEGVGLLRTEMLFLDRATAPDEDEQRALYAAIASALGGLPVIVRTLDIGGDKPVPYLAQPAEANPFLGVRGLRLCLERPELLRCQLRAILRAAGAGRLRIMLPMVADVGELRAARAVLAELSGPALEVGIMIEVPSAAILADALAPEVDFFSIGSNDLTQYTLAMDRTHPALAARADGLHPAVLRLIAMTVAAAHAHGKWVGVCGELAADPAAVPILVGLGVDELSVNVPAVPAVKAQIRALSFAQARELAVRVLGLATAGEVRKAIPP
ncbi:MAG TPA: phosphoenolpyruvate--protein phosphotransferase [Kofleriaceae bacterium]|nr:phosphoenolpyruvate--protein phosphotransferase [Kofleriaceae bacterium]